MSKIIRYDSPEACSKGIAKFEDGTEIVIYKARRGREAYIGEDEHLARYVGSTHKVCPETGEVFEKTWIDGPTVRARKARARYLSCKQAHGEFPVFVDDNFFADLDDLIEYYFDQDEYDGIHGEVLFGEALKLNPIELSYIYSDAPLDCDIDPSTELQHALNHLNETILAEDTGFYVASSVRPTDEQLSEWDSLIEKAREVIE